MIDVKPKRTIEVEIIEKNNDSYYCPMRVICIGSLNVVEYGYDYSSSKNSNNEYTVKPLLFKLKEKKLFKTIEDARAYAYGILDYFITNKLECKQ